MQPVALTVDVDPGLIRMHEIRIDELALRGAGEWLDDDASGERVLIRYTPDAG